MTYDPNQPRNHGKFAHKPYTDHGQLPIGSISASKRNETANAVYERAAESLRVARTHPLFSPERDHMMGKVKGYAAAIEVLRGDSNVFQRMINDDYRHITKRARDDIDFSEVMDHLSSQKTITARGHDRDHGLREALDECIVLLED